MYLKFQQNHQRLNISTNIFMIVEYNQRKGNFLKIYFLYILIYVRHKKLFFEMFYIHICH